MNLVELTKKLIEFQSYTNNAKEISNCLEFCINYFKDKKNVFIKKENVNGNPSVLISNSNTKNFDILEVGHIDVVPVNNIDMFRPKIIENTMYGRGTGDMKGSVAVAMKVFEYVLENNLNLKYGLLIVSDEETGGIDGAKYWAEEKKLTSKIVFDADAGLQLNRIIYKVKACFFIKLISKGKLAHGSMPWLGVDAIENLIKTVGNLRKFFPYISENNVPEDKWITTMHVGKINGGKATNAISDYAEAELDFRYTDKYTFESLYKLVKDNLENGVEMEILEEGIPVFNDIKNDYLELYKNILEKETGEQVTFDFATGASDSRYFAKSNKNTVIISNQATCGDLHGDNEFVKIDSLEKFYEIRKSFVKQVINRFI